MSTVTTVSEPDPAYAPAHDSEASAKSAQSTAAAVRREAGATVHAVRTAANDAAEHVPDLVRTVRAGASDGVQTIRSMPEPAKRLLAVFSLGLGVGLMVAGAPRLLVGGALLPALGVAATSLGLDTSSRSRTA